MSPELVRKKTRVVTAEAFRGEEIEEEKEERGIKEKNNTPLLFL